ncbi:MAG: hypothetical protein ACLQMF_17930 [Rectinemataceae bacterium]
MPYQALPGFQEQATLRNFKYSSEYIRPQQDEASQALLFRHYEITLRVEYIQNSAKPGGSPTKNLLAACGIVLLFAVSSSCKNPAAPPPDTTPKSYISYSLNGNGTQTTYSDGVTSGSGIITVSVPDIAFASIPSNASTPELFLYASMNNAAFESSSTDFIYIYISFTGTTISAGDYPGANVTLNLGGESYLGSAIDLHLDQAIDNSSSVGQTVTGTFSGTITYTPATGSPVIATISGSFKLVYQTSSLTVV